MKRMSLTLCLLLSAILSALLTDQGLGQTATAKEEKNASAKSDSAAVSDEKDEKPVEFKLAAITLKGSMPEGNSAASLFGIEDANLMGLMKRIRKAGEDKKVGAVVLRLRNPAVGRGTLHELASEIKKLKASGKKVWAEIEFGTPADYLIACQCDKIVMPESGFMLLPGTRAELMFYRKMFDKLQIEPDMLQMGDFKGAGEPYMREKMSAEFRAQLDTVLKDFHQQMVATIAMRRGLTEAKVQEIIDEGLLTANRAKELGLIDVVGYEQDWRKLVVDDKDSELKVVENYAKKEVDTDFSGMAGFVKLMELFSQSKPAADKSKQQKIAVVYAVGAITSGKSASSLMGEQTMGSDTIVEALDEAAEDEKVGAIVLRVNSPGGSALASDLIWNKIQSIEKPVVASMGDVAASGGYYISMGCDKIYAEPATLTGSIGVIGGKLALGRMLERFGLTTDTISYGQNSGMFNTNEKFSETERRVVRAMMEDTYRQFTSKAAAGRHMPHEDLMKLAGGRVWTGRQAKDNGLVDELGTLDDAIRAAQKLAKMEVRDNVDLKILPAQKSFFEQLMEGNEVAAPKLEWMPQPVQKSLGELSVMERLLNDRVLLLTPYTVPLN